MLSQLNTLDKDEDTVFHIANGGTFDSVWDPRKDTAVPAPTSIVPYYLSNIARIKTPICSESPFLKDSRETSIPDRRQTVNLVAESIHRKVLITTGTFLMPELGRMIQHDRGVEVFRRMGGRVAITGSLIPMRGYLGSDGGFNLGMSMALLQENMKHAVVVVMNGSCFDASDVSKDLTRASFSSYSGIDLLQYDDLFVIPAGGSIDFEPDGLDNFVPSASSGISNYLRDNVNLNRQFDASTLCVKDSRNITPKDKNLLAEIVRDVQSNHVLIALGIYRLKEVRDFLRKKLRGCLHEKRVMLTGSRLPLQSGMSDAPFNLGYALGKIPFMKPGIHTSICGRICDEVDPVKIAYNLDEINLLKRSQVIE